MSIRSGAKQGCPLSPMLFNMVLEILALAIREEKETEGIRIGKAETKLSFFADDMMICLENPRDSSKKLLQIINNFGKVAGYKINPHKSSAFLYVSNKVQKQEVEREIPFKARVDTIKYLCAKKYLLPKQIQGQNECNYKILFSQIKSDLSKWNNICCTSIGWANITKMTILPKLIYLFSAIPIRLSDNYF